jgi:hypothetical protein
MAVRDDSVVRGGLIACIIALVLSLAANVYAFMSANWARQEAAEAKTAKGNSDQALIQSQDKIGLLSAMIGSKQVTDAQMQQYRSSIGEDGEIKPIVTQFETDMTALPADQPKTYRALPELLNKTVRDRNTQLADLRSRNNQLIEENKSVIDRETKARQSAEMDRDARTQELAQAREEFNTFRQDMIKQKEDLNDQLQRKIDEFEAFRTEAQNRQNKLLADNSKLQDTVNLQRDELALLRREEFEAPQGRVTNVLRGGQVVWINLGSADGLRPGVSFSVLGQDEIRVSDARPKAQLEVTRIGGAHLAEARVVYSRDVRDPVLENDKIYSPMWSPGRPVKFALAGTLDLNGDGIDDSKKLRGLIEASGGEVVAQIDAGGNRNGGLTKDTRWLVVGDVPEASGGDDDRSRQLANAVSAIGQFKAEADRLGVGEIGLDKLMGYLKNANESLTIPIGRSAGEDAVKPIAEPGVQKRWMDAVSDLYQKDRQNPNGGPSGP